ncbi:unnamed protein product, partial [Prorocentrum cordatum]
ASAWLLVAAAVALPDLVAGVGTRGALATDAESREAGLHDQMRDMMADDDDDDYDNVAPGGPRRGARLLQVGSGARAEEVAGLRDSAAALSAALGPQWNGDRLEADAKQKTDALLQGIAGHKAFGALNNMLNMLR